MESLTPDSDLRTITFKLDQTSPFLANSSIGGSIKAVRPDVELKRQVDQLEAANPHLRGQLQHTLINHKSSKSKPSNVGKSSSFVAHEDDVATLLQKERAQQEVRNAKSLALLRSKDEALDALEARCTDAVAETAQLKAQLHSSQRHIDSLQQNIDQLLQSNNDYEQKLHSIEQNHVNEILKIEEEHKRMLEEADITVASLTSKIQEHERKHQQDAQDIHQMQRFLSHLLGIALEHDSSSPQVSKVSPMLFANQGQSTEDLLAAKAALEKALVLANLRAAGINLSMHSTPETLLAAVDDHIQLQQPKLMENHISLVHADGRDENTNFDELAALSTKIAGLYDEADREKARADHFETVYNATQQAAASAENELHAALQREEEFRSTHEKLQCRFEEAQETAKNDSLKLAALTCDNEVLMHELDKAKQAQNEMQTKFTVLQNEAHVLAQTASAAETNMKSMSVQCTALKEQFLDAQLENDDLKRSLESLEKKVAFYSAKAVAQEAAGELMAVWHSGGQHSNFILGQKNAASTQPQTAEPSSLSAVASYPAMRDLALHLQEAASSQLLLHDQLKKLSEENKANKITKQRLRISIARLQAVLRAADPSLQSNTAKDESTCLDDDDYGGNELVKELQTRLTHALAAQEGQAACFASLMHEIHHRETALQQEVAQKQSIESEFLRHQALSVAAIGALHVALAQLAEAEGDHTAALELLHAEADPVELAGVAAAVAAKMQQHAQYLIQCADQQQQQHVDSSNEGEIESPKDVLLSSQREVIKALSTQIHIVNKMPLPGIEGNIQNNDYGVAQSTPINPIHAHLNNNKHVLGLCMLLLHQLEHASHDQSIMAPSLQSNIQSMQSIVHVLHAEIIQVLSSRQAPRDGKDAHSGAVLDVASMEKHVVEMGERIAVQKERIAVLTSANEAARTEAAHAKESIAVLTREFEEKEEELMHQLRQAQEDRQQAMALLVGHVEDQRSSFEDRFTAEMAALRDQIATQRQEDTRNDDVEKERKEEKKELPPGLVDLLDGLEGLLADAAATEARLKELESIAAEHAKHKAETACTAWSKLTATALRARGIAATWKDAQQEYKALEEACTEQRQRADAAVDQCKQLEKECKQLHKHIDALHAMHEEQARQSADLHAAQLASVQAAAQVQRQELHHQIERIAHEAAERGHQNAHNELNNRMEAAEHALREYERRCARLKAERDAVHAEFTKFRDLKKAEIQLLESRLGLLDNHSNPSAQEQRDVRVASAEGEIAAACKTDGVAAALREAKLERAHRHDVQQALAVAEAAEKKARVANKAAEEEIASLRQRLNGIIIAAERENARLSLQLEESQQHATNHAAVSRNLEKKIAELNGSLAEYRQQANAVADREYHNMHAMLEGQSRAVQDLTQRITHAQQQVEYLQADGMAC